MVERKNREQITRRPENRETPGAHLKIARLISPKSLRHPVANIVGIPFEENQLKNLVVSFDGQDFPLLQMMHDLDLIGQTDGVPHLSVGGWTTQLGGWIKKEQKTSYLEPQATRSYLVGPYSVQGTGLTQYIDGHKTGFGLDMPFRRNSGEDDISGGASEYLAKDTQLYGHELWLTSLLTFGSARFARPLKIFDYHPWMKFVAYKNAMQDTSIIIREDGKRNISRRELAQTIGEVLPLLTDSHIFPVASSEPDGHNAFRHQGHIVFTDYESVTHFSLDPANFIIQIGNSWFLEEIRKQFGRFCSLYSLKSFSHLQTADYQSIFSRVSYHIDNAHYRDDLIDPIKHQLHQKDRRALLRYAMAGVIGSRALGKYIGTQLIISDIIQEILNQKPDKKFTLVQMETELVKHVRHHQPPVKEHLDQTTRLSLGKNGQIYFHIGLDTFGLPIDPNLTLPLQLADIYRVWPYDETTKGKVRLRLDPQLTRNPFTDLPDDLFSRTLYCKLAGAFANVKGFNMYGPFYDKRRQAGYSRLSPDADGIKVFEFPFTPLPKNRLTSLTLHLDSDITAQLFPKTNQARIIAAHGLHNLHISQLNQFAYACHVVHQHLHRQTGDLEVTIRG